MEAKPLLKSGPITFQPIPSMKTALELLKGTDSFIVPLLVCWLRRSEEVTFENEYILQSCLLPEREMLNIASREVFFLKHCNAEKMQLEIGKQDNSRLAEC